MKSPADFARQLARQWQQSETRCQRLQQADCWPLQLKIGKPPAGLLTSDPQAVRQHIEAWRQITAAGIGRVDWQPVAYRTLSEPIPLPLGWRLDNPSQWIAATADSEIQQEYRLLEQLVESSAPVFHPLLIRQRSLWRNKPADELISTLQLAERLEPGCAQGQPLRLLAGHGVDTKFFERNGALLTRLLDERFAGAASEQGLATFLDAYEDSSHWVLVVPLSTGLLPFQRIRLTTAELAQTALPGSRLLVVENEQCIHLLPELPDTLAILGAGLDLQWLSSPQLAGKQIGYWGDLDSWGLLMLARARQQQPGIQALLMERSLFDLHAPGSAVSEQVKAPALPPDTLQPEEAALYCHLLQQEHGRLEQEFIPQQVVQMALLEWCQQLR